MSKQGISTGSDPNDGTGDTLLAGTIKINNNFNEIYDIFGDGSNLVSFVSFASTFWIFYQLWYCIHISSCWSCSECYR